MFINIVIHGPLNLQLERSCFVVAVFVVVFFVFCFGITMATIILIRIFLVVIRYKDKRAQYENIYVFYVVP